MVDRYTSGDGMLKVFDGGWVHYSDYEALATALTRARANLKVTEAERDKALTDNAKLISDLCDEKLRYQSALKLVAEVKKESEDLLRSEFICQGCGLRKDGVTSNVDF